MGVDPECRSSRVRRREYRLQQRQSEIHRNLLRSGFRRSSRALAGAIEDRLQQKLVEKNSNRASVEVIDHRLQQKRSSFSRSNCKRIQQKRSRSSRSDRTAASAEARRAWHSISSLSGSNRIDRKSRASLEAIDQQLQQNQDLDGAASTQRTCVRRHTRFER